MKRLFALIAVLVCLVSSAGASRWTWLPIKYNASAKTLGAETISGDQAVLLSVFEKDDAYAFDFDAYVLLFIFSGENVKSISIRAKDESSVGGFLLACLSVISAFGGFNETAFGDLVYQYSRVKTGKKTDAYSVGLDAFQLNAGTDGCVYSFTYLNNDLSFAD